MAFSDSLLGNGTLGVDPVASILTSNLLAAWQSVKARAALVLPPEVGAALQDYVTSAAVVVSPILHDLQQKAQPSLDIAVAKLDQLAKVVDNELQHFHPWQICLGTFAISWLLLTLLSYWLETWRLVSSRGVAQSVFDRIRTVPGIRYFVLKEEQKVSESTAASLRRHCTDAIRTLPAKSSAAPAVLAKLKERRSKDVKLDPGSSAVSGALYLPNDAHKELLDAAFCLYSASNPLHFDVYPSLRQMEAEVISMVASMLGGGPSGNSSVCGAMTSGGTESILLAVKASRDYMAFHRGITKPEILMATSAHAAYWKAADYFKIKTVVVPVASDYRLSASTVSKHITRNTILIIASAPGFPHGVVDHVEDIARVARRRKIPLHVDACLGGFVLPFAKTLGYPIPPFDFSIPGVTSMSVDTHKFGLAHKGTSVVLYHSKALRRFQYLGITEWTGGLYISPGLAGSRPGALIAAAWVSLIHLGLEGFLRTTEQIMAVTRAFMDGLKSIPELQLVGHPDASVVAFKAKSPRLNIYKVNDLLSARGWHLNALQRPASLHFCFTASHSLDIVRDLLKDLGECVQEVKADPKPAKGGNAALYGAATVLPDRGLLANLLIAFQDAVLDT